MKDKLKITVILSEKCNLNCSYCYAYNNKSNNISKECIDSLIDNLKILFENKEYNKISVNLFGGEPLLLWDNEMKYLLEKLIKLKEKYNVVIPITTNGSLITEEMVKYIKQYNFMMFNISIDWSKDAHLTSRKKYYDETINGIRLMKKYYGKYVPIKGVISPLNMKYLDQVFDFMDYIGLPRYHLSIAQINDWGKYIDEFKKYFSNFADMYIKKIKNNEYYSLDIFTINNENINYGMCSCKNLLAIAPNGDIYPCQRLYNNRSPYKLGNIIENGFNLNDKHLIFKNCDTSNFINCQKCDKNCFPLNCFALNYECNKNIFQPNKSMCELSRFIKNEITKVNDSLKDNDLYQKIIKEKWWN